MGWRCGCGLVVGVVFGWGLKYRGLVMEVVKSMGGYNGGGVDRGVVERMGKNWEGWVRWVEKDEKGSGIFSIFFFAFFCVHFFERIFSPFLDYFSGKPPTLALYSMFLSESRCQIRINDSVTL